MVADAIGQPDFVHLIQQFLYDQCHSDSGSEETSSSTSSELLEFCGKMSRFKSAIAIFVAPSNISKVGEMWCEHIPCHLYLEKLYWNKSRGVT